MNTARQTKYWLVVASKDHIERGKKLGIVQANHGKAGPMRRLNSGDLIVFYSPKVRFEGKEPLKKFTAIAMVKDGEMYQGEMGSDFDPYRRDVEYLSSEETEIQSLIEKLTFIRNKKSWGFIFRFGFFEIPAEDFKLISIKMNLKHTHL